MPPLSADARRTWVSGVAAAVLLLAFVWAVRAYTPDDAYISFSYAQRHAAGDGWVASAGTPPVEGFSNPLWIFLLELAARLDLDLMLAAKFAGVLCAVGLVLATARLGARLPGAAGGPASTAGALLLATWPPMALWAASGMENAFYGLLLVLGAGGVVCELWGERRSARSAWWWVAALWTRPEAFGLVGVVGLWRLTAWRRDRWNTGVWCATAIAGWVALAAWRYATFGEWLPNTYYAKQNNLLLGRGLAYLGQAAWSAGFGTAVLAAVIGLVLPPRGWPSRWWHPAMFLGTLTGAHGVFVLAVGGDWMHQYRFLTPLAPFVAVLAAWGLGATVSRLGPGRSALRLGVVGGFVAAWLGSWPSAWAGVRTNRSVDIPSATWAPYRQSVGAMAAALGPGGRVVIPELGYPSYATDLRILDPLGLASAHIAHLRYERVDRLLREVWRPDAVKVHSLVGNALHLHDDRWFRDHYMLLVGPSGWDRTPTVADGWYVRRDRFERPVEELPPARALFGGAMELRNARLESVALRPAGTLRVRLTWVPIAPAPDWRYVLHIRTPAGEARTVERAPLNGWRPTSAWPQGQGIEDCVDVTLGSGAAPGWYQVAVGFRGVPDHAAVPATVPNAPLSGAPVSAVPVGRFEIVTNLSAARMSRLATEAEHAFAAGDAGRAWDILEPVRASGTRTPAAAALLERVGRAVTEGALAEAADHIHGGDGVAARAAVERARAVHSDAWPALRDAFVATLLSAADAPTPAAPDGAWQRIRLAALALHADPASRAADRLVRRLWHARITAERAGRLACRSHWAAVSSPLHVTAAEVGPPAGSGSATAPRADVADAGTAIRFTPALPVDLIREAEMHLASGSHETRTDRYVLQLTFFGTAGYRAAAVPLAGIGEAAAQDIVRFSCERDAEDVVLSVLAPPAAQGRFTVTSLAPSPWDAPAFPPQVPVLVRVAVLRVPEDGAAAVPVRVVGGALQVRAEFAGASVREPAWTVAWEPDGLPPLTVYRPYELRPRRVD